LLAKGLLQDADEGTITTQIGKHTKLQRISFAKWISLRIIIRNFRKLKQKKELFYPISIG
jgi:hypothetical protein